MITNEVSTDIGTFEALLQAAEWDDTPQCESSACATAGRGSHAADWLAGLDKCEHNRYLCNAALRSWMEWELRGNWIQCSTCLVEPQHIASWHPVRF